MGVIDEAAGGHGDCASSIFRFSFPGNLHWFVVNDHELVVVSGYLARRVVHLTDKAAESELRPTRGDVATRDSTTARR